MSVKDMNNNVLVDTIDHITQEAVDNSSTNIVPAGTPIVATRMSLGKIVTANFDSAINQDLKALFLNRNIENSYIIYWYRSIHRLLESLGTGTTVKGIRLEVLKSLELPLPSFAEQRQIASQLDTLLEKVVTLKAHLDNIQTILIRFRQSVLAAATSGRLTTEWRGSKSISFSQSPVTIGAESEDAPKGWNWENLIDLAELESGHTPRKTVPDYWTGGDVFWISLQDIRSAHGTVIEDTKYKPTMLGIEKSSARLLPAGTVCFSRDISVGYTTIMGKSMSTTQHFANWICGKKLSNKYLMFALMAAKDHLVRSGQGTTVKTIYMPALKKFRLLLPPLEEQLEIIRCLEKLFAFTDVIEQRVKAAKMQVDNLSQSILAKAFCGELTAEWREKNHKLISGENSAEALLLRIKSERTRADKSKKSNQKKTKKLKGNAMRKNQILSVRVVLELAGTPLSAQTLLTQSGYSTDATTVELERFFLDIREQLKLGAILRERSGDEDIFALVP
jgi:type I restriction enzyme S subunit